MTPADACPEQPSYVRIAARLTGRGLSDFNAVGWIHRQIAARKPKARGLAALSPEEWRALWALAGKASAEDGTRERKGLDVCAESSGVVAGDARP